MSPLIGEFFFCKYTVGPSCPSASHLRIQPSLDGKQYVQFAIGKPQMQRDGCTCFSVPVYIRAPVGFGILGGPGTNPYGY